MNVFLIYKDLNMIDSYNDFISRFNCSDRKVYEKFMLLFLEDETYDNLILAYEQNNCRKLFFHAHTLYGISLNLGFLSLNKPLKKLCKNIKSKSNKNANLITEIKKQYNKIINAINKYKD